MKAATVKRIKANNFADLRSIDNGIKRLRGITANANNLVQDLAVAILSHDKQHGDCSRALELVKALPNSFRRAMLVNWFAHYGNIGMDVNGDKVRHMTGQNINPASYDKRLESAKVKPWFDEKSVPGQSSEVLPYTFAAFNEELLGNVSRLRKRIENGGTDKRPLQMSDEEKKTAMAELDSFDKLARKFAPVDPGTGQRETAAPQQAERQEQMAA